MFLRKQKNSNDPLLQQKLDSRVFLEKRDENQSETSLGMNK